jgi:hypothetical protein
MITSNPSGISCPGPGTCSADFLGSSSVILTHSVLHNQTEFIGWTGGCSGMGNCTLQLLSPGAAIIPVNPSVTAHFRIHTNTQSPPITVGCPDPSITGMVMVAPNCGKIPTSNGATLECDAQGYFCCGVSGGTPTAHCPGGNETQVTCARDNLGVFASDGILIPPGGCYK